MTAYSEFSQITSNSSRNYVKTSRPADNKSVFAVQTLNASATRQQNEHEVTKSMACNSSGRLSEFDNPKTADNYNSDNQHMSDGSLHLLDNADPLPIASFGSKGSTLNIAFNSSSSGNGTAININRKNTFDSSNFSSIKLDNYDSREKLNSYNEPSTKLNNYNEASAKLNSFNDNTAKHNSFSETSAKLGNSSYYPITTGSGYSVKSGINDELKQTSRKAITNPKTNLLDSQSQSQAADKPYTEFSEPYSKYTTSGRSRISNNDNSHFNEPSSQKNSYTYEHSTSNQMFNENITNKTHFSENFDNDDTFYNNDIKYDNYYKSSSGKYDSKYKNSTIKHNNGTKFVGFDKKYNNQVESSNNKNIYYYESKYKSNDHNRLKDTTNSGNFKLSYNESPSHYNKHANLVDLSSYRSTNSIGEPNSYSNQVDSSSEYVANKSRQNSSRSKYADQNTVINANYNSQNSTNISNYISQNSINSCSSPISTNRQKYHQYLYTNYAGKKVSSPPNKLNYNHHSHHHLSQLQISPTKLLNYNQSQPTTDNYNQLPQLLTTQMNPNPNPTASALSNNVNSYYNYNQSNSSSSGSNHIAYSQTNNNNHNFYNQSNNSYNGNNSSNFIIPGKIRRHDLLVQKINTEYLGDDLPNVKKIHQLSRAVYLTIMENKSLHNSDTTSTFYKRERNRLASRTCRLKKRVIHEKDKLIMYHLFQERTCLLEVLLDCCEDIDLFLQNGNVRSINYSKTLEKNYQVYCGYKIVGNYVDLIDRILRAHSMMKKVNYISWHAPIVI